MHFTIDPRGQVTRSREVVEKLEEISLAQISKDYLNLNSGCLVSLRNIYKEGEKSKAARENKKMRILYRVRDRFSHRWSGPIYKIYDSFNIN